MNLFENFDVTDLTFRKPPANDSLTTFKELQELNNLKLDKDFVVQKDNIIDNFEKINSAAERDGAKAIIFDTIVDAIFDLASNPI